ncbi:MAG TPA: 50S ribosomal protein L25/general stress protein Ctc [Acidimicrobiia bacterium]|jgi:large subunit ribosomal protein L25
MEEVTLAAEVRRGTGKSVARKIRREGKVPAVVYGLGTDAQPVAVPGRELQHILHGPGGVNTLINLDITGKKELVLARQIQRHPVRHTLVHVDLIRVSRDVAIAAEVPIHLIGEPEGVRDGGLLEQLIFTLSVEAKPADIPQKIEIDVSGLSIGDHLSVSDLVLPPGVVTTQESEEQVAHVAQPRGLALPEEIEAAEAEAAAEAAEAEEGAEPGAAPSAEGGES